ncbi:putative beta-carotene-binding protein [Formica fusca]
MFAAVFAFALATAYATEIPSYINVCGRRDPNLNKCVADNIKNLQERICKGLTEMNLPPMEPLNIDRLVLSETDNNKIYLNDVQITGLCSYIVKSVDIDIDKLNFNIEASFNRLYLNGTYDIDVRILVPIAHKAPIYITADNINAKVTLQAEMTTYKDKKHMYISEIKTSADIKKYDVQYGLKENEISQLGQILGDLIGKNQEEFIQRFTPPLEEEISKWLLKIVNNIMKMYSYDELFPDRT